MSENGTLLYLGVVSGAGLLYFAIRSLSRAYRAEKYRHSPLSVVYERRPDELQAKQANRSVQTQRLKKQHGIV